MRGTRVAVAAALALTSIAAACSGGGSGGGDDDDDGGSPTATPTPGACGDVPSFEDGLVPSSELHVDPATGNDGTGDGSAGNPFATLERAAEDATPGTAIRLHPGDHATGQFIADLEGTAGAPIWIGGIAGQAKPRFDGGAQALQLAGANYVVLHDIEVTGSTANGINVDDGGAFDDATAASFLVFRGLDIHDMSAGGNNDCLKLSGLNDFVVRDSRFANCGAGGSAIDMVGCHDGVLARNVVSGDMSSGIQAKGGSANVELRANRFTGMQRPANLGGSTDLTLFRPSLSMVESNAEARELRMIANVVVGGDASAIAFVGCIDCLVANNTFIDPAPWIVRILQETPTQGGYTFEPSGGGRYVNNLVWFSDADVGTHVNVGPDTAPDTFVFEANLWYAHDAPASSEPSLPVQESAGVYGEDPLFADAPGGDYTIPAGSPATGAGVDLPELTGDASGACWAATPSIGAFEGNPR